MAERTICFLFYDNLREKKMSLSFFLASEIVFIIKDCVTYPPIKFAKKKLKSAINSEHLNQRKSKIDIS